jgi:hypothetical protein
MHALALENRQDHQGPLVSNLHRLSDGQTMNLADREKKRRIERERLARRLHRAATVYGQLSFEIRKIRKRCRICGKFTTDPCPCANAKQCPPEYQEIEKDGKQN